MSDLLHNLPKGITEDDLLALVESDLGDPRGTDPRGGTGLRPVMGTAARPPGL